MNKLRLLFLLIVTLLVIQPFISNNTIIEAQASNTSNIVWQEFPSFEPKLLDNYPSAGYLTWNTTFGLYTVDKSLYWFSFKDRYGVQQVSKSVFWINTTATIDIAKITNVQVTVKNDTTFQVKYSATYKGGSLTKDTVVGNFTVTFKFYRDIKPKISVQFAKDNTAWNQGGLGDFNIVWVILPTKNYLKINETSAVDYTAYTSMVKVKETTAKEDKKCEVGDSASPMTWTGSWLLAFWDDVEGASILYTGLDKVFGGKGITVVFPVNDGQIDPSFVGASTASSATYYPFQRKSFYANGRFWVFYSDGSNMVFSSSTDGSTWTSPTAVNACSYGYYFSVWYKLIGFYHVLFYARSDGTNIYYRYGTLNSDGTIDWSISEVTITTGNYPFISVDTNNYVWIGYTYNGYPYATKRNYNDGSAVLTQQLSTTSSSYWRVSVIPLTAGKILAVYAYNTATIRARRYDGTNWGTEVQTDNAILTSSYYSCVAQGDNVHIVYQYYNTFYYILYTKYDYSSNSFTGSIIIIGQISSSSAPVISINTTTNDLYVFWAGYPTANHIYYKKYTASTGQWETDVDWISETGLTSNDRLTCFYQSYNNYIGLVYMNNTVSPYNVKFALLANTPPNAPTLNNPTANYRFNPTASVTFSWTFNDPDYGDSQSAYQLQIGNSDFTTIYLDTGKVTSSSTSTTQTLPSTVGIYYWRVKTWDSQNAEGPWSSGRAIIVDRIKVNSLTVDDARRDVGTTVTISVQLVFEYDSSYITSGTFTLNGLTLSYSGSNGVWRVTESKSTVQSVTYNNVSGTEGTYGLTVVNMNSQSVTVIWDRIEVYDYGVSKSRTDVGSNVLFWWKLRYDYDDVVFDNSKGSVSIGDQTASYNSTYQRWEVSITLPTTPQLVSKSLSFVDNTYGLTVIYGTTSQSVIADKVQFTLTVASSRVNVRETVQISVIGRYAYDNSAFQGTYSLNDTLTKNSVGKYSFKVSSMTDSLYGLTVFDSNVVSVVWDKDKMCSFAFSGGTLANMTFKLLSEYYSNTLNNTDLTLRVYFNNETLCSISAKSNSTGYVSVVFTKNIVKNGTLTFNLTDADGIVSYSYSCPVYVYVENIEVYSIDPMILYTGDSLTITMLYKSKANINGTYLALSNIYWKALIYTDKYYGYYNFPLYNGTFANVLESKTLSMPIALSEGSYMLNMTLYIRGSDEFLGNAVTPYFVVKSRPVTSGGAPATVVKLPLTVVVRDSKGKFVEGVNITITDMYNGTVWSGKTDVWGSAMITLNPGTYTVTVRYDNQTLTDSVTISDQPVTKEFTLQAPPISVTPVTVALDNYSILWLSFGLIGAISAVILERKEKTYLAIPLGLFTIGAVLHSLLVMTHQMPPFFTIPKFDLSSLLKVPSFSLPSLPQFSLDMQTITLIAVGVTVPIVIAYYITQRGGTRKRRVRVGKFGATERRRTWK